jgi:hypothetical protein
MNVWQKLAWVEWYRSFLKGQDNRDFLWLTILLSLTLILALLLWGGREGLLNKFVDVSVGYIEGAGIPIWLATNNVSGVDRNLLQNAELSQQNIELHPYREVEWHEVSLPNNATDDSQPKIWNPKKIPSKEVPFNGWAVSFNDPLWKMGMKSQPIEKSPTLQKDTSGLPLEVILNRSLFEQYFNCAVYVKALKESLPAKAKALDSKSTLYCLANDTLWLSVKVGRNRELLPFQIHWQSHIPTMQNLAFLFPLSTLNTLKIAKYHPKLRYYPESQAGKTTRVKGLMIWVDENEPSEESIKALISCLQNPEKKHYRLTLKRPLPKNWVAECAKQSNISLQNGEERLSSSYITITEEIESHYFQYNANDFLSILCQDNYSACQPCEDIPSLKRLDNNIVQCQDTKAKIDMIAATGSYQKAFAYIENRKALTTQVEKIKSFQLPQQESKAFYIHPTYEDALVRFRFIDEVVTILEIFLSPFFLVFLTILLGVQLSIVITHRKHNYGILLAKGMSLKQIREMVFMQIGISFLVAMDIAIVIDEWMQWLLAVQLEKVISKKPYIDHIIASQLDLLPLSWLDYMGVGIVVFIMLVIITFFLFKGVVSKRQMEPAYLF